MGKRPSRIELLELDIDLRLSDLWSDALTEDAPGSLCRDHGYRIPDRRVAPAHEQI
jgi:hypothetical protein